MHLELTRPRWEITAQTGNVVRVDILGPIGMTLDGEGIRASEFVAQLADLPADTHLDVHLSSGGGSAPEGVVIYNNLRRFGSSRVTVDGIAASAASIIAMAGREIVMSPGSLMMIHNGRGGLLGGTADEFRTMADLLDKTNASMAEIYAAQAGGSVNGWLEAMHREQWYTATEAVAAGLADRVDSTAEPVDEADIAAVADIGKNVFGWSHAGRAGAPAPTPIATDLEVWTTEVAAALTPPDYLTQLAALTPPDYITQLAALAPGKDGAHADS